MGDRRTWRRGLGHAIAHAGCRHGFDVLGLRRVWAETQATNVAAIRILTGVGMQQTSAGVLTRFEITVDAWQG